MWRERRLDRGISGQDKRKHAVQETGCNERINTYNRK